MKAVVARIVREELYIKPRPARDGLFWFIEFDHGLRWKPELLTGIKLVQYIFYRLLSRRVGFE